MSTKLVKRSTPVGELKVVEGRMVRGHAELVQREVALEPNHYSEMKISGNLKYMLSPEGFDALNEICGLEIHRLKGPGHFADELDELGFRRVTVSMAVIGYSLTGKRHVISGSLTYSPAEYFRRDLADLCIGKVEWKTTPSGKKRPVKEVTGNEPVIIGDPEDKPTRPGRWKYFPQDRVSGLWCDVSHPDVISKYGDYLHAETFRIRKAEGILRRNLGCQHPGGPRKYLTPKGNEIVGIARAWVPVHEEVSELASIRTIIASPEPDDAIAKELPGAIVTEAEDVGTEDLGLDFGQEERDVPAATDDDPESWFGQDK